MSSTGAPCRRTGRLTPVSIVQLLTGYAWPHRLLPRASLQTQRMPCLVHEKAHVGEKAMVATAPASFVDIAGSPSKAADLWR